MQAMLGALQTREARRQDHNLRFTTHHHSAVLLPADPRKTYTIRRSLDLFRPSPPRLRARHSFSNINFTHSSSPPTPNAERKSLDLEGTSGSLGRENGPEYWKFKMAFASIGGGGGPQATNGPDLQEIITEASAHPSSIILKT
jgi:hypothetical protein